MGYHVKESTAVYSLVQPSEGARKWRQGRGSSYAAPQGQGMEHLYHLLLRPHSHPTPTQPAWLAQQSLGSRRFRAVIIQFPLLLILNGIILFLRDKCFHWPLLLVWHVQSPALDTSPLSLGLPSLQYTDGKGMKQKQGQEDLWSALGGSLSHTLLSLQLGGEEGVTGQENRSVCRKMCNSK